jgi:diguanylate cyclase (GGDEF)-like protein
MSSREELEAQLGAMRRRLEELTLEVARNDEIMQRAQRRELRLLQAESFEALRLVCLILDIDHFKRVNDSWGHAAGDAVLRELAQRIDMQVRASDVAARYGGEEFVVLLPNTDVSLASLLAERIRTEIAASPIKLPCGESVTITASIGIAEVSPGPDEKDLKTLGDSLIARADVALYAAKSSGRDRVVVEAA